MNTNNEEADRVEYITECPTCMRQFKNLFHYPLVLVQGFEKYEIPEDAQFTREMTWDEISNYVNSDNSRIYTSIPVDNNTRENTVSMLKTYADKLKAYEGKVVPVKDLKPDLEHCRNDSFYIEGTNFGICFDEKYNNIPGFVRISVARIVDSGEFGCIVYRRKFDFGRLIYEGRIIE